MLSKLATREACSLGSRRICLTVSPIQKSSWVLEDGLEIEVGSNGGCRF